jgi:hypothetical protein
MKAISLICLAFVGYGLPYPVQAAPSQPPEATAPPMVVDVSPKTNSLGKYVTITLTDLHNVLTNAVAKQKAIVLFINGRELGGSAPTGIDETANTLEFQLKRTTQNKDVWTPLLQDPTTGPVRKIAFSVGLQDGTPLLVGDKARNTWLRVIGFDWWTLLWVGVFGTLVAVFLLLATYSDILRSPVLDNDGRYPFSLSRCQGAFWLFITVMSFVFILITTGDLATLNGSVLALIGISAATYVSSALLEDPDKKPAPQQPPQQPQQQPQQPPQQPQQPQQGQLVRIKEAVGKKVTGAVSKLQQVRFVGHFLGDILADTDGISVHRFQIFVWTIVLGIIFLRSVIFELSMPEFNGTLLALMGISSATYVGAKLTPAGGRQ